MKIYEPLYGTPLVPYANTHYDVLEFLHVLQLHYVVLELRYVVL